MDKKHEKSTNGLGKPDKDTLHKTDPQKNMEGPVSSMMQNIKDEVKKNDKETQEEADRKKDENI